MTNRRGIARPRLQCKRVATMLAACAAALAVFVGTRSASAQAPTGGFDQTLIVSTVQSVARVIQQEYFDTSVADTVATSLTTASAHERYGKASSPQMLAQMLNGDLYAVTHDKHLAVTVKRSPSTAPTSGGTVSAQRNQPTNAGFRRVEILAGNIGYLDLTMFLRPAEHRDALAAAMLTLRPADALILDMRDNSGGSPGTIALLVSYLFNEASLPLFDILSRSGDSETYSTEPASAQIDRNGTRPIWVLTSSRTFSGGEGLAFLLQERHRAQVVGEKTAGAANPGRAYPVNDVFDVTVPNGQIRTAISHDNWEGKGVTPDVSVTASQALDVALDRARQRLRTRNSP